jgi:hypothetical protein
MAERIEERNAKINSHTIRVNAGRVGNLPNIEREMLYDKLEWLYAIGLSDLQIALEAGCCDRTVRRWRKRNGLANYSGVK